MNRDHVCLLTMTKRRHHKDFYNIVTEETVCSVGRDMDQRKKGVSTVDREEVG